jgi:GT2 family glycosyltransferase
LRALALQAKVDFELIVVDNASADASLGMVKQYFPDAKIIRNSSNTGFCHAHNQAILVSEGQYYLPLNPDVEMEPGYIFNLFMDLEARPEFGSAAGKLLLKPRQTKPYILDSTGLFLDRRRRQFLRGHAEVDLGQYDQPGEVFGVDGAAPLYRRDMLEDIKIDGQYFDECFFAHKEDVDLAWRARLLGWGCWYNPKAVAFHERNFKPGQREAIPASIKVHATKNRYLLLIKNEQKSGWFRDGIPILWYDLKIFIFLCLYEHSSLKAFSILWNNRAKVFAWRKKIGQRIRVKPAEILIWFK